MARELCVHYMTVHSVVHGRSWSPDVALRSEVADRSDNQGYRRVFLFGKNVAAHRLAWLLMTSQEPPAQIDHINRDRSDNRWANLRAASPQENSSNRIVPHPKNRSSGLIGVTFDASGRTRKPWRARIMANGKAVRLGRFSAADEAHRAYMSAKAALHPFANLTDK